MSVPAKLVENVLFLFDGPYYVATVRLHTTLLIAQNDEPQWPRNIICFVWISCDAYAPLTVTFCLMKGCPRRKWFFGFFFSRFVVLVTEPKRAIVQVNRSVWKIMNILMSQKLNKTTKWLERNWNERNEEEKQQQKTKKTKLIISNVAYNRIAFCVSLNDFLIKNNFLRHQIKRFFSISACVCVSFSGNCFESNNSFWIRNRFRCHRI